jgi:alpha-beta hydrolase superfamily lysophospholipase
MAMSGEFSRSSQPRHKKLLPLGVFMGVFLLGIGGGSGFIAYLALNPSIRHMGYTQMDALPEGYREVSFETSDGLLLRGWYTSGQNGAVVILVHGFARDRSELLPESHWLVERGYGVLLFDTRAQGQSAGTYIGFGYSEALDVAAGVDFVRGQSPAARIGVLGYSMGAVAAIQAAAMDPRIEAVIAVSPFATLRDSVNRRLKYARALLPLAAWWGERLTGIRLDAVRPVDSIGALAPRAVLIMHAEQDGFVTQDSGLRLYQAAGEPKMLWSVPGVAHVDFRQAVPREYERRVIAFFDQYLIDKRPT